MKAVVTGMIATYPVGGVVWDYGQYLLGLQRLGFDVHYLEDTGLDAWDRLSRSYSDQEGGSVRYLADELGALSPELASRWHLRRPDGSTAGMSAEAFARVLSEAVLFLNVSGGTLLRPEYAACGCTVLIDTDPGWNHYLNYPAWDANPGWQGALGWRGHDHHFTYAEGLGRPECALPCLGVTWRTTRPPVCLDRWERTADGAAWTTLMTWATHPTVRDAAGRVYGDKHLEFALIEDLPVEVPDVPFELVVKSDTPHERWEASGWVWRSPEAASATARDYRTFVQASRGELSVAKNVYVATRSGWFSCRSSCYLAAGRPVVVQDTGFSQWLPTGLGLLTFTDREGAVEAVRKVEADYAAHADAAREVAVEHFGAERVLGDLLRQVGL